MSSKSWLRKTTLAGRDREVATDLEGRRVAHRDPALARVDDEVGRALDQALALGLGGPPEDLGVGGREVGRRHRVDELAGHELEPVPVVLGQRDQRGELGQVLGGQQVALLQQREIRQLGPLRRGEAPIPGRRRDHLGNRRRARARRIGGRAGGLPQPAQPRLEAVVERDHGARIDHRGRERGRQVQARRRRERGEVRHRETRVRRRDVERGLRPPLGPLGRDLAPVQRQVDLRRHFQRGRGRRHGSPARERGSGNGARRARGPGAPSAARSRDVIVGVPLRTIGSRPAAARDSLRVRLPGPAGNPPCTSSSSPGST